MENFREWKMMGVQKRMRQNVVPHKFECQKDRKRTIQRQTEDLTGSTRTDQSISVAEFSDRGISVAVQVNLKPKYRSKSTQCNVSTATASS